MGLDMYLNARRYVSDYPDPGKTSAIAEIVEFPDKFFPLRSVTVSCRVGYWRKANAIHNWFVNNIQSGEDDCKEYYVSRAKLQELKMECLTVLLYQQREKNYVGHGVFIGEEETPPQEEWPLPPSEGFFFGSNDRDDYYYEYLKETVSIIDAVCNDLPEQWEIYYESSW